MSYKVKYINSIRFISSSLTHHVMLIGYLKFIMKSLVIKTVILSVSFKELEKTNFL